MSSGSLLGWAFAAGMLAAVNPCGFAVLPGYLAHYLGSAPRQGIRGAVHGLGVGLAVTAGKLTIFAVVAAVFLAGGRAIVRVAPWAGAGIGAVLVVLGIWVLAGRAIRVPLPALRAPKGSGYRSAYLFGLGYGTCSLSCCLPIFLGIFAGLGGGVVGSVGGAAALFAAYGLGLASLIVPLFAMTGNLREKVLARMRRLSRFAGPAGGALLAAAGVLLLVTWVPLLGGARDVSGLTRTVLVWQTWAQQIVLRLGTAFWVTLALVAIAAVVYPLLRDRRRTRTESAELPLSSAPDTPAIRERSGR